MQFTLLLLVSLICLQSAQINAQEIPDHPEQLPANYTRALTDHEVYNLEYLIRKLSSSWPILLMNKGELTNAGNQLSDVHPLSFFAYIFTDAGLNRYIRRMNGSAWPRFRGDWAASMKDSFENNEITDPVVEDFAKRVGVPVEDLRGFVKERSWEELIQYLVDNAPYVGE